MVDHYACGINCECGNAKAVAEAIVRLAADSDLRIVMGKASRRLAEEKFDRRHTYGKIMDEVEKLVNDR